MAKKKEKQEQDSNLSLADRIDSILGGAVSGVDPMWEYEVLPCGVLGLEKALAGGFRYGACTELYGEQHAGKSLLTYAALANNQRLGGLSILYDSEGPAYDPEFFRTMGGNPDTLLVKIGFTVEEFFSQMVDLCKMAIQARKNGEEIRIAVGWDSIANTGTDYLNIEGVGGKRDFSKAQGMSEGCKLLGGLLREAKIALICTNQIREKIGASEYDPTSVPGGRAMLHFAGQRIELKFDGGYGAGGSALKNGDIVVGRKVRGIVQKNRAGPSSRQFHFQVWVEGGFPHPDWEGHMTNPGINADEAAFAYYIEPYATFGKNNTKFFTTGGAGWYTWDEAVVKALGKPTDWCYKKFQRKHWSAVLADAPQLRDASFMTDVD